MRVPRLFVSSMVAATLVLPFAAAAKELRVGLGLEPTSIDPHYFNLGPNNAMARAIFDPLVLTDEKQRLVPGLAVSWKPIDATTWEFKLRQGVKFHDGTPFTADDVLFTFERAPNVPNSPSSFAVYTKGKQVTKVNDYTIRIKTAKPYPLMPNDLSTFVIVSQKNGQGATTEDYNSGKAAIGTGPFKFVEWVPGDRLILMRNDNYWGEKAPWDKVVIKPIKSGPTRVAALLTGDVDLIDDVPTTVIARLKRDPKVTLSTGISDRLIFLQMDLFREHSPFIKAKDGGTIKNPFMDLRVRKAISIAIDRNAIVERVMEQQAIPAGQLLPAGFFGLSDKLKPDKYDFAGAKKLLTEAGYPNGFKLTLHGPNDRYVNDAKICEAIAQMLTRVGIETSVETMPKSVYFKRAAGGGIDKTPEFSFTLIGWGAATGEASSPLKSLLHTYDKVHGFGTANFGRYSNAELDKLIEQALATIDDGRRAELLAKATDVAINDLGLIPLHYQVNTWATRKGLKYIPRTDGGTRYTGVVATK
jgi:peptide/nickel transport system substrate-binding protein